MSALQTGCYFCGMNHSDIVIRHNRAGILARGFKLEDFSEDALERIN